MHSGNMASEAAETTVKKEPNYDTVRQTLREAISRESFDEIRRIVRDVDKLSKMERLLLYMELPSSLTTLSDPLRQPLNPLGSRFEIQLTITWIKTHLEEDQQVSLPKHEVYDDYLDYCNFNSLKPLSTADFGKVMKQVYPQVRPRRLGTRGNSRYCYAGLKKRLKLEPPTTPECGGENGAHKLVKVNVDYEQEVDEATSFLIREWAGNLFNTKFACVKDLTLYLIDKIYVDNRSSAAHTILSSMSKAGDPDVKHKPNPDGILLNGNSNSAPTIYDHGKRKIEIPVNSQELDSNVKQRPNLKRSRIGLSDNSYSDIGDKSPLNNGKDPVESRKSGGLTLQILGELEEINAHDKQHPAVSVAMVAEAPNQYTSVFEEEDPRQAFLHHDNQNNTTPNGGKEGGGGALSTAPMATPWGNSTDPSTLECIKPWELEQPAGPGGGVPGSIPQSQLEMKEPIDEEVDKYFKDNSPNSNDDNQKLSQLRTMLVEKLKSPSGMPVQPLRGGSAWGNPNGVAINTTAEPVLTSTQPNLSTRRRVSFIVQDPAVQQQQQQQPPPNGLPQNGNGNVVVGGVGGPSPGARKRHCSFQPISPRQGSLPQSPSASPFISPRSTPVHMMRSRHSSGSALPLHMLPQGGGPGGVPGATTKGPFGSSGSDISRAATFGSASECSTPFISPHGTPIPFNRSRHNSAQGRLCRSRHSSGVGLPFRYNVTPFSPMALSNLNNPYSPQPSTPVGSTSGEDVFTMNQTYIMDGNMSTVTNVEDMTGGQQVMMHDRSRHSSAESDPNLVKSAPMSPHGGHHHHNPHGGNPNPLNNSYIEIAGQRLRHQSAGDQPNPAMATLKPPEWMQDPTLAFGNSDEMSDIFDHRRSQSVPIVELPGGPGGLPPTGVSSGVEYMPTSMLESQMDGGDSRKSNSDVVMTSQSSSEAVTSTTSNATAGSHHTGNGAASDDLDMTLSALKDCDKDFSKFVQEVERHSDAGSSASGGGSNHGSSKL